MKGTRSGHLLTDASQTRRWLICESGDRWLTATRRFITLLMPDDLAASIQRIAPEQLRSSLVRHQHATVLWEVTGVSILEDMDFICKTTAEFPNVLQIAATSGLDDQTVAMLSEIGVTISIERPEQLPSLAKLMQAHVRRESVV